MAGEIKLWSGRTILVFGGSHAALCNVKEYDMSFDIEQGDYEAHEEAQTTRKPTLSLAHVESK